jgi:hypothetical protein
MSKDTEIQTTNARVSANIGIEEYDDDKKQHVQHLEDAETGAKEVERDVEYDAQERSGPPTGLRRMLRRNPSYEFIRELAIKDTEELEKPQVKKVCLHRLNQVPFDLRLTGQLEKRIFWMIVPALCIDYIFYYIDKDT